ncbi:hypothetical protein Q5424_01720 [Conexibacter sp. JD483]|uniref:hypothetical protein n=1 Tax=unclassified Conexibacter TaxID=2627773 RepID=UPI00271ADF90|nr:MULTISPECIES: hypothetical protein [unclassified Conexibacter]MDO8185216.1 hypothetical protein [Conexibacter sp. CPCC 205706]MDO8198262.1 hypothetical protein [Conexibacter sp. CPCC 205762]MDR9367776.1 hypothetical protein [Conexibacter sp. JD483]
MSRVLPRTIALLAVSAVALLASAGSALGVTVGAHPVTNPQGADLHYATSVSVHGPYAGHLAPGERFYYNGNSANGDSGAPAVWCNGDAYGSVQKGNVWILCGDLG